MGSTDPPTPKKNTDKWEKVRGLSAVASAGYYVTRTFLEVLRFNWD